MALLTGGGDRPYALGLAASLISEGVRFDFIGSDFLEAPELRQSPQVQFLNLRGDMRPDARLPHKIARVALYYWRLLRYAAAAEPRIFHILWNNKIELFDRTLLLAYYRLLAKRVVLTVHNVNVGQRDGNDSILNRLTLRVQYRLADRLFVHTELMKRQLVADYKVSAAKIEVIPFGINNTVPSSALTRTEARRRLGLDVTQKVLLFFGNIAPYKGLEHLVEAMAHVSDALPDCRLIIAGRPKGSESYWAAIQSRISALGLSDRIIERIEYVPDAETEVYFKAADALVLPYTHVFQSGVLFLGYNFGLPTIATDIGSLPEDIVAGETGFVCKAADPVDLANAIECYFASELFRNLPSRRPAIHRFASERYSWSRVGSITTATYRALLSAI